MNMIKLLLPLGLLLCVRGNAQSTYAEKLGFPAGAKVLILHVDDGGMSWDSNTGVRKALGEGVATSVSVMMPCPWVPDLLHYLKDHPGTDAGLHLTLTSEWRNYRWGPLAGQAAVPGLVDTEGALWASVEDVVTHATADEVEKEIRAQLQRALTAGLKPTHLDSHMGTLFAKPDFLQRYIKVGVESRIPVMFPGGHNTMIGAQRGIDAATRKAFEETGQMIWQAGLPVLDDLHNVSYDWGYPGNQTTTIEQHRAYATAQYIKTIQALKPGLTMVIMHCSEPTEVFQHITDSGNIRRGDLLAMTDPAFKKFLTDEHIILTTWREVMERRSRIQR